MDKIFKETKKNNMTNLKQNPFVFGKLMDEIFPAPSTYYPAVNIYEAENCFLIELKVPGIKKEEMSIQMEKGLMTIIYNHAENKATKFKRLIKNEFATKSFKRTFSLDEKINTQAIEAKLEAGILTLTLPIKEAIVTPKTTISIK
jgi:HSP20 family protein